ncbi:helix-turn-helix domain-containing protein [Azospirillum soli]|uniref:helix-turn-helix domain-containing protein n=1 Tax=Azospirillum soli TaxID=1304799 RepID=UPI001AEA3B90|nr:hypothetical protein [Azospirillum soli]MBP2311863.1 hypothetical protein [Azospirillum soli]
MADTPRIESVSIAGTVLTVGWRDGTRENIDIAGWLARPGPDEFDILKDPAVLANPKVANWGTVVAWDEEGDIGIDNIHLRLLADQQKPFEAADIAAWQERLGLSNSEAADLLGVGVSTFYTYKAGTASGGIPRGIQIACRAVERDKLLFEAHYRPRPPAGRPPKAA